MNISTVLFEVSLPPAFGQPIDVLQMDTTAGSEIISSQVVSVEEGNSTLFMYLPRVSSLNYTSVYRYRAHNSNGWGPFSDSFVSGTEVTFEPSAPGKATLLEESLKPNSFNVSFAVPTTSANPQALGFL